MSLKTADALVQGIVRLGIQRVRVVGNGEPTLHPNFEQILHLLVKASRFASVLTNGQWREPDRIIKSLLDSGVALVEFSIDAGGPVEYARSRGGGNYSRLLRNIELLSQARHSRPGLLIKIRLMERPSAAPLISQETRLWRRFADIVQLQRIHQLPEGIPDPDTFVPSVTLAGAVVRCPQVFTGLQVEWNGRVPLCSEYPRRPHGSTLLLGNLTDTPVGELWNGPTATRCRLGHLKQDLTLIPACAGCPAARR